ncbi:hypothetical protein TWF718_001528 [Orbilia javanica]|uniref:Uncharacterized protein n=1 Tax=Orbilia javanica TaxID=47235 RepID=A0AAN8NDZ6_9PEZI
MSCVGPVDIFAIGKVVLVQKPQPDEKIINKVLSGSITGVRIKLASATLEEEIIGIRDEGFGFSSINVDNAMAVAKSDSWLSSRDDDDDEGKFEPDMVPARALCDD